MTFLTSGHRISRRTPSILLPPAAVQSSSLEGCPLWRDWLLGRDSQFDILLTRRLLKRFGVAILQSRLPLTRETWAARVFSSPFSFSWGRVTRESWPQPCSGRSPKRFLHFVLLSACSKDSSVKKSVPRSAELNFRFQTLRRLSWCSCQQAVISAFRTS